MDINTEWLRVRQVDVDNAEPISVTRGMYDFNPDAYELVDEPAVDSGNNPLAPGAYEPPEELPGIYDGWKVADLKAEIDTRNDGRDPADDNYLDGSGNKPDLVAALEADDATQPGQ